VGVLPDHRCGVVETARISAYLADQSARQCGPCVFGLRAIADTLDRIACGTSVPEDLARVQRWTGQLAGRGACRHPDGAARFVGSALRVFAEEFGLHDRYRRCSVAVTKAA
jgi:NADH:ubiquinone oxidoreductase subunit F (NADH-binding)